MRSGRMTALALASLLALPTMALAQQGHHGQGQAEDRSGHPMMGMAQGGHMMGSNMMGANMMGSGMMGMMAGHMPAMILNQKQTLNLEPAQVERLEKLRDEVIDLHRSHMGEMTPLMQRASQAMHAEDVDLSEYKAALEQLSQHRIDMMMQTAQISQEALEVLNEQQRSEIRSAVRMMDQMMGGMMQGAAMGAADCPMLQQMGRQGAQDPGN